MLLLWRRNGCRLSQNLIFQFNTAWIVSSSSPNFPFLGSLCPFPPKSSLGFYWIEFSLELITAVREWNELIPNSQGLGICHGWEQSAQSEVQWLKARERVALKGRVLFPETAETGEQMLHKQTKITHVPTLIPGPSIAVLLIFVLLISLSVLYLSCMQDMRERWQGFREYAAQFRKWGIILPYGEPRINSWKR